MNRLAQEAATEHVGVGSDDLKDKNPMRKRISSQPQRERPSENTGWLDLEALARVEVTSEDAAYPIESALLLVGATGWRAESPGEQTIRLFFEAPQRLKRIRLLFREEKEARTQEFVLRWSPTADGSSRDIVRQQYHFSPSGATEEIEEYRVELEDVVALEVTIVPNISGGDAYASLAELRLAGNGE
ncbi:MAG: hypothetical protein ACJ8LM_04685 [Candidatus Udaeobacter sp.]